MDQNQEKAKQKEMKAAELRWGVEQHKAAQKRLEADQLKASKTKKDKKK